MYILMYMRSESLADVRRDLPSLIDIVSATHERIVITRHGQPAAVLLSLDDLEAIEETMEILSDPDLLTDIRESLASAERYTIEQVRADLAARTSM